MTLLWAKMPYQTYQLSGADARHFLQGQLTQDIDTITSDSCHYGAYCNHKGRMFANVLLFADEEHLYLRLHNSIAETVMKRLQLFVLRAKVTIQQTPHVSYGLSAETAGYLCDKMALAIPAEFHTVAADGLMLCALPNGYFEAQIIPQSAADHVVQALPEDGDAIARLAMHGGHFDVVAETSEILLPQQTPLEPWGGISYTKGCYVGQEIIARNKYLGKVKKTLAFAESSADQQINLNDNVVCDGKTVGSIIATYYGEQHNYYQAIMALDAVNKPCEMGGQTLHFHPLP